MSIGCGKRPAMIGTGRRSERAGRHDHPRSADDESSHVPVGSGLAGLGVRPQHVRLDPDGRTIAAGFEQDPGDLRPWHDPSPGGLGGGEVGPNPGPLRAAPTPEWAASAVPAAGGVPSRPRGRPAELGGPAQDDLVLRRDDGRFGDVKLILDRSNVVIPSCVGQPLDPVAARPVVANPLRGREARHPVDQRAAADRRPREHRHRAVPCRQQAVVEVEPPEGVELVGWHRCLVDERAGLENDDRPACPGKFRRDDPAAGAGADDDRVGLEDHRLVRRAVLERRAKGTDGYWRGCHLGFVAPVADRLQAGIPGVRAGIGVGQERQELPQPLKRRPPQWDGRPCPRQQIPLAGLG
jgi:hypothetical protein